jgi:hypothetical protein
LNFTKNFKEIRLIVRELDTTGREVSLILQQIHQEDGLNQSNVYIFLIFYMLVQILRLVKNLFNLENENLFQLEISVPKQNVHLLKQMNNSQNLLPRSLLINISDLMIIGDMLCSATLSYVH